MHGCVCAQPTLMIAPLVSMQVSERGCSSPFFVLSVHHSLKIDKNIECLHIVDTTAQRSAISAMEISAAVFNVAHYKIA